MEAATALLAVEGTQRELLDMMQTREELYDLLDYQGFEERDRAHFGGRVDK
jgi:methylisocitrate lyase